MIIDAPLPQHCYFCITLHKFPQLRQCHTALILDFFSRKTWPSSTRMIFTTTAQGCRDNFFFSFLKLITETRTS